MQLDFVFYLLRFEALQGKRCPDSLLSGGGRSVRAKISREEVIPGEHFLVSTKLDTFCYPTVQTAPVLHAVVLAQYGRVTDGRTDRQTELL